MAWVLQVVVFSVGACIFNGHGPHWPLSSSVSYLFTLVFSFTVRPRGSGYTESLASSSVGSSWGVPVRVRAGNWGPSRCQPVVIGADFSSNRSPQFGVRCRKTFIQCKLLVCDAAQLGDSVAVELPLKKPGGEAPGGEAPVPPGSCSLCSRETSDVSLGASAWNAVFSLRWKAKVLPPSQRGGAFGPKPRPGP